MFTPDLDLKVTTRCTIFSIQDKTGVDTGDGDLWSGVSGLDPDTLTSATIRIVSPSGTYTETDVLSQIPSPVTDTWWFNDMTGTEVDGLHNLIYTLETTDSVNITSFSDYSGTVLGTVKIYAPSHGLVTGQYIRIQGTVNYDGFYYFTNRDVDNFYITVTYVADDGATTAYVGYQSTFYPYVYCISEAGVEKMFANLSQMVAGTSRKKYLNDANIARGYLQALKSAISSSNTTAMDNIQSSITQMLDYYEVDPNL